MKLNKFIFSIGLASVISIPMIASSTPSGSEQTPKKEMSAAERFKAHTDSVKAAHRAERDRKTKDYQAERERKIKAYRAYRDSVLNSFVSQMKQPWVKKKGKKPTPKPIDNSIEPEIVPIDEIIDFNAPKEDIAVVPVVKEEPKVEPKEEPVPVVKEEPKVEPKEEPAPVVKEEPQAEPKEEPVPVVKEEPKVEPKEEPAPVVKEEPKVEPKEEPAPVVKEEPQAEPKEEPVPVIKEEPKVEPKEEPTPVVKEEPKVEPKEEPAPVIKEEPKVEPKEEPAPVMKPKRNLPKASIIKREPEQVKIDRTVTFALPKVVRPTTFVPIIKPDKPVVETHEFEFYGSDLEIRIDESCKFKISNFGDKGIAETMEKIAKNEAFNYTIENCLAIRKKYQLCDWAYLQMLQEFSNSFFEGKCNEATLLTGYLYCMSGYKLRFAYTDDKELILLFALQDNQLITSLPSFSIPSDGYRSYYSLNPDVKSVYICDYAFPKEQAMSLYITELPKFPADNKDFTLKFKISKNTINYTLNKNLIDFFDKYPTPMTQHDVYSKWAYYALTPLSAEAKATAYPEIKKLIAGKSDIDAVNMIMDWIESYAYGYDSKVWGYDRAFFPDETLWYPSSDCEDHAILLARLVNDLLGLETALIYYPGHLAAAVRFNNEVRGDYLLNNGVKYTVCDPTIYYAKAGTTMRSYRNKPATLILLHNGKKK